MDEVRKRLPKNVARFEEDDFSEEDMAKLIGFIKEKIDIPLPNDLIRNILDAEYEYFNGR